MIRLPIESRANLDGTQKNCINCYTIKEYMENNKSVDSLTLNSHYAGKLIEKNGIFRQKKITNNTIHYFSPKIDFLKKINVNEYDSGRWCKECGSLVDYRLFLFEETNTVDVFITFFPLEIIPKKIKFKLPSNIQLVNNKFQNKLYVYNLYKVESEKNINNFIIEENSGEITTQNSGNVFTINLNNHGVQLSEQKTFKFSFDKKNILNLTIDSIDEYDVLQAETYEYKNNKDEVSGQYVGYVKLNNYSSLPNLYSDIDYGFYKTISDNSFAKKYTSYTYSIGKNDWGQLGIDSKFKKVTNPTELKLKNLKKISSNGNFVIGLTENNFLYAWGNNKDGQLGIKPDNFVRFSPIKIKDLQKTIGSKKTITDIQAAWFHSVLLDNLGFVWAWGKNNNGQLGNGSNTSNHIPQIVKIDEDNSLSNIVQLSTKSNFTLALDSDGYVWKFGDKNNYAIKTITINEEDSSDIDFVGASSVSVGDYHSLAIKDNKVWSIGYNLFGQLGLGSTQDFIDYQSEDEEDLYVKWIPVANIDSETIKQVACGSQHSVALGENGDVWTWGKNDFGQIGDGNINTTRSLYNRFSPRKITRSVPYVYVAKVLSNKSWTLNIPENLDFNTYEVEIYVESVSQKSNSIKYQLTIEDGVENENYTTKKTSTLSDGVFISVSTNNRYVKKTSNRKPVIKGTTDGTIEGDKVYVLFYVDQFNDVDKVLVGSNTNFALKKDGTVWCWGENHYNQIQLQDNNILYPTRVRQFENMKDIFIGNGSVFYVKLSSEQYTEQADEELSYNFFIDNLKATDILSTSLTLSWSEPQENPYFSHYEIYVNDLLKGMSNNNVFNVISLQEAQTYRVYVIALDIYNNQLTRSKTILVKTQDNIFPISPTNLSASNVNKNSLTLNWSWESTFDEIMLDKYQVYKSKNNENLLFVGQTTNKFFNVTGLSEYTQYNFAVRVVDKKGNISPFSDELTITTADKTPPQKPKNLKSIKTRSKSILLSWEASTDSFTGISKYLIYQNNQLVGEINKVNESSVLEYLVEDLNSQTRYTFYVIATDMSGNNSLPSDSISVTTMEGNQPTSPKNFYINDGVLRNGATGNPSKNTINIKWDESSDSSGIENYNIVLKDTKTKTVLLNTNIDNPDFNSSDFTNLTLNKSIPYEITVKAKDNAGNESDEKGFIFEFFNINYPPSHAKIIRIQTPSSRKFYGIKTTYKLPSNISFNGVGGSQIINFYLGVDFNLNKNIVQKVEAGLSTVPTQQVNNRWEWFVNSVATNSSPKQEVDGISPIINNGDTINLELFLSSNNKVKFVLKNITKNQETSYEINSINVPSDFDGFYNLRLVLSPYVYGVVATPLPPLGITHSDIEVQSLQYKKQNGNWEAITDDNSCFQVFEFPESRLLSSTQKQIEVVRPKQYTDYSWSFSPYMFKVKINNQGLYQLNTIPIAPSNIYGSFHDYESGKTHVRFDSPSTNIIDYSVFLNSEYYGNTNGNVDFLKILDLKPGTTYNLGIRARNKGELYSPTSGTNLRVIPIPNSDKTKFYEDISYKSTIKAVLRNNNNNQLIQATSISATFKLPKNTVFDPISSQGLIRVFLGMQSTSQNHQYGCGLVKRSSDSNWKLFVTNQNGTSDGFNNTITFNDDQEVSLSLLLSNINIFNGLPYRTLIFMVNNTIVHTFTNKMSTDVLFNNVSANIEALTMPQVYVQPIPPWGTWHNQINVTNLKYMNLYQDSTKWINVNSNNCYVSSENFPKVINNSTRYVVDDLLRSPEPQQPQYSFNTNEINKSIFYVSLRKQ